MARWAMRSSRNLGDMERMRASSRFFTNCGSVDVPFMLPLHRVNFAACTAHLAALLWDAWDA